MSSSDNDESKRLGVLRQRFSAIRIDTDDTDMFDFGSDLIELRSLEAFDFHYELLRDTSMDAELYDWLCRMFSRRGDDGEDYLLSKFATESDPSLQATALQILGSFKYNQGRRLKDTAALARTTLESSYEELRCKALWVMGWLGASNDVPKVATLLEKDPAPANRQWAATALMQIFHSHPSAASKALKCLGKALETEADPIALGGILVAVQEISGKRFGLSAISHEPPSAEKLQSALAKARRMFARSA